MIFFRVEAQMMPVAETEALTYVKLTEQGKSFAFQNGSQKNTYELASDECGDISPNGRYLIISAEQSSLLRILYLPTSEIIFETAWLPNWRPCIVFWIGNNVIGLEDPNSSNDIFKFENLSLIPYTPSTTYPEITYPILPHFHPTTLENFILQNPVYQNIYVYEKCPDDKVYEGLYCAYPSVVVYDTSANNELEILYRASGDYMRGYVVDTAERDNRDFISGQLVSWTPNGRYLAYYNPLSGSPDYIGKIQIYDLQLDSYIEDNEAFSMPNISYNFQWTSSNGLLIWKTGKFIEASRYHDNLVKFIFFYPDTETYIFVDGLFEVLSSDALFSLDGNRMLILGNVVEGYEAPAFGNYPYRADLILISTTTGEHTVIDTDVTEIITWRSICDFTVSDSTSLISTMQTEPYSVICLDENVTYTLTAPLPTITGDITIIGNGAQIVMAGTERVFDVASTGGLTLKNITVSGGNAVQGGAIYNAGDLTLENVVLDNNSATDGGAIYNVGNLEMDGGAIQNNTATNFGGGIYNLGEMDVDGVNIRDNNAVEGSGVYQGE